MQILRVHRKACQAFRLRVLGGTKRETWTAPRARSEPIASPAELWQFDGDDEICARSSRPVAAAARRQTSGRPTLTGTLLTNAQQKRIAPVLPVKQSNPGTQRRGQSPAHGSGFFDVFLSLKGGDFYCERATFCRQTTKLRSCDVPQSEQVQCLIRRPAIPSGHRYFRIPNRSG
jgi:hypothetical protein